MRSGQHEPYESDALIAFHATCITSATQNKNNLIIKHHKISKNLLECKNNFSLYFTKTELEILKKNFFIYENRLETLSWRTSFPKCTRSRKKRRGGKKQTQFFYFFHRKWIRIIAEQESNQHKKMSKKQCDTKIMGLKGSCFLEYYPNRRLFPTTYFPVLVYWSVRNSKYLGNKLAA